MIPTGVEHQRISSNNYEIKIDFFLRIFSFLQVVAGLRSSSGFLIFILYEGLILHTQLRTWFSFDWNNE